MRLESALYSSSEGLTAHGQAINVVGDNVANANTTGFKESRAEFADLLAEGEEGYRSTTLDPSGNGVQVDRVRQEHKQGIVEFTGRSLDAAVDGNGFFILGDPTNSTYTRAGNFSIDGDGFLVNADGQQVMGFQEDGTTLGSINMLDFDTSGTPTTEAAFFANLFSSDPIADEIPDNPETFRDIGKTANFTSGLTVYDSLGVGHDLTIAFYKQDENNWVVQAYGNGDEFGNDNLAPVKVGGDLELNFDPTGVITEENAANSVMNVNAAWAGGAEAGNFTIDFSGMTQFGGATAVSAIQQNGEGTGEVKDYEIGSDGQVYAVLESGTRSPIATLALADFPNVDGLERAGSSIFQESENSGDRTVGTPDSGRLGGIEGAALERSTVDIAEQFTDLVIYQRGYQASSQTFNAVNTALKDTLNLIR